MATVADISRSVADLKDETIAIRREFHAYPELAYEEVETAGRIVKRLEALGMRVETGIGVTGVLGIMEGGKPGKTLLIRADMDALPMPELPDDRPHKSKIENRNHSCGHDMNMAVALGAAAVLARHKQDIAGRVAFVFQPGDEPQTGARKMFDDGLLDKVKPDYVLSHHPTPEADAGKVIVPPIIWSSMDMYKLAINGAPGWFGRREQAVDTALIAGQLITALYQAMAYEAPGHETVLFNVTSMQGTGQFPGLALGQVELQLALQTYNPDLRKTLIKRLEEIVDSVVKGLRGSYTLESTHALPPAVNSPEVSEAVINAAMPLVGEENIIREWRNVFPDDSALFLEQAPGCMFMLGVVNKAKGIDQLWHTPGFDIDEDTLALGVEIMSRATLDLLK
jgi:amidohydrolase